MKWFTGDYAQAEFSNEMVAIIGDSAKHPTANMHALKNMPWTQAELKQVEAQFNNLASVPNYPGYYILDRYTNFAFLSAYNDNKDPTEELLSYINTINNEITRKREEFKLETLKEGQKLSEKRLDQASTALDVLKSKYNNAAYAAVFEEVEAVIANSKIAKNEDYETIVPMLQNVAEKIMEFLPDEGTATPSYYVKVSKQTALEKNGGYAIDSLSEQKLLYFTAQCLLDAAKAFNSYR
jgi:flagellin-like hook-associated protein FlgL